MATLVIHRPTLSAHEQQLLTHYFGQTAQPIEHHHRIALESSPSNELLTAARAASNWDLNLLPDGFDGSQIKLIVSDMDSTLINIECIDEIGAHLGIKDKISEITEAAMRGELNFEQSLTQRVALLAGTPLSALEAVYHERLQLNEGAEQLIAYLKQREIKFALVSGGFTFFTDRLQARLGLDFTRANQLDFDPNAHTTGKVLGEIIGAEAKRTFLLELCDQLEIGNNQTIAVGDGANDLRMMQDAGLSVAYHAKPTVQTAADTVLNHRGLDAMIDFLV
ncbi:MAG: phosphoserine phosphatase SerB [Thiotrichales bacterium]|jgi:phosphoserine phosphatase|nr:phosphoserine phosphatase SerB [Thiotrichales bacterium]